MNIIQILYEIVITSIAFLGIIIFWKYKQYSTNYKNIRIKKDRYNTVKDFVRKRIDEKEINKMLDQSGVKIDAIQYQLVRYIVFIVWFSLINISYFINGGGRYPDIEVFSLITLFLLISPKKHVFGKKTPFFMMIDLLKENNRYKQNLELFRAISHLKNLIITKQHNPPDATFILEQLRKFTVKTKPIFNYMIMLWNMGRKEDATEYFKKAIGTKEATDLANLFLKLDELNPIELKNQLIVYQESIKSKRETNKIKINEMKSLGVYFLVAISSILVLANFAIVAYYIDAMKQLHF